MNEREIKMEQLVRLQELQRKALEAGLDMEIITYDSDSDGPWIVGYVCEPAALSQREEDRDRRRIHYTIYRRWPSQTEEDAAFAWEEEFNKIINFIKGE